jgi:membrane complex biogenesis BtpA family protein
MSTLDLLSTGRCAIGVIHVPPFPTSFRKPKGSFEELLDYCERCATRLEQAGFDALILQNVGDEPTHLAAPPETIAYMTLVGNRVRRAVSIPIGISLLNHDGKAPLAVAKAVGADFVRLKTYVGVMVKMTGLLTGCYYEAVKYRREIQAENIALFADIFDREGQPLGAVDLADMAHFAEYSCMADALILTGHNREETYQMLQDVAERVTLPLLVGGGVNTESVGKFNSLCQGFIIGAAVKEQNDDFSEISLEKSTKLIDSIKFP